MRAAPLNPNPNPKPNPNPNPKPKPTPNPSPNPTQVPREWQRAFYNFDNTPWSFVTLFVVATREGWPKVLWSTIDSGEFEEGKLDEGETEEGWFFLFFLYIVAVSFFLINMFTGILYQQFSRIRNELNASQFLTRDQRNWAAAQKTPTLILTLTLNLTL